MIKIFFYLFVFLLYTHRSVVFSQACLKKAYLSLSIYNYFDAKKRFEKYWHRKHHPAAAFGLSLIYGRSDNPFHHSDSAIAFATRAWHHPLIYSRNFHFQNFEISSLTLRNQIAHLALSRWMHHKRNASISWCNGFLAKYYCAPSEILDEVITFRDSLVLQHCLSVSHPDTTRWYLHQYPMNHFKNQLWQAFYQQQYHCYTQSGTIESFYRFIRTFPQHPNRAKAILYLFFLLKKQGSESDWNEFIQEFPHEPITKKVWIEYFLFWLKKNFLPADFLIRHPEFPYQEAIIPYLKFKGSGFVVVDDSTGVGIVDTLCRMIVPPVYDEAELPSADGPGYLRRNDTVWFIDIHGKWLPIGIFQHTEGFMELFAAVQDTSGWHFIFMDGTPVSENFSSIQKTTSRQYIVKKNNFFGLYDAKANALTPLHYIQLTDIGNGFYFFERSGSKGILNPEGKEFSSDADWIGQFSLYGILASKNGNFGILDSAARWILKPDFKFIRPYPEKPDVFLCFYDENRGIIYHSTERCVLGEWSSRMHREQTFLSSGNGFLIRINSYHEKPSLLTSNGVLVSLPPGSWTIYNYGHTYQLILKKSGKEFSIYDILKKKFIFYENISSVQKVQRNYYILELKKKNSFLLTDTDGNILWKSSNPIHPVSSGYFYTRSQSGRYDIFHAATRKIIPDVAEILERPGGNCLIRTEEKHCKWIPLVSEK